MGRTTQKRKYGSGSLEVQRGAWYGRWWIGERYVNRKIGAVRVPGGREGLTEKQAEKELHRLMTEVRVVAPEERMTFREAGERYLHHLEHVKRRRPATVQDYRIMLNKHLVPYFGENKPIERIEPRAITAYMSAKSDPKGTAKGRRKGKAGLSPKTISNHLNFAHGVFAFALKQRWCTSNPVAVTDRPEIEETDPDIRFLDLAELEALLRAAKQRCEAAADGEQDVRVFTDYAMYLTAGMTGLRQGELVALRWRDVDWSASVIRVRRNRTRRNWGKPKSKRSSRAVPMADRVGGELDRHFKRSAYKGGEQLVFCHPQTGDPYDDSQIRKRFYGAMKLAGMGDRCGREAGITFHSLRHTYGTRMAAAGTPMRTLQEWMGHRHLATTEIYADYAPDPAYGAQFHEDAFTAPPADEPTKAEDAKDGHAAPKDAGVGEGGDE
ncbi:MAG: tyrosine-type recombinase/integrase [Solirubrobacteraceae bacterium]